MFAHTSTFAGGATSLSVNTSDIDPATNASAFEQHNDSTTNENLGTYTLELEVPANETKYCFRTGVFQSSSQEMTIAAEGTSTNGCTCKGTVDNLFLCINATGTLIVKVTHSGSSGCIGPYPITIKPGAGAVFTTPTPGPSIDCFHQVVMSSTVVKGVTAGYYDVQIGGATFEKAITVISVSMGACPNKLLATAGIKLTASVSPGGLSGTWSWSHSLGGTFTPPNAATTVYVAPAATSAKKDTDMVTASFSGNGFACSASKILNITAPRKFDLKNNPNTYEQTIPKKGKFQSNNTPTPVLYPVQHWHYGLYDQFSEKMTESSEGTSPQKKVTVKEILTWKSTPAATQTWVNTNVNGGLPDGAWTPLSDRDNLTDNTGLGTEFPMQENMFVKVGTRWRLDPALEQTGAQF